MAEATASNFEMQYTRLFVRAFRVARRIVRSDAEAEDIAAETMVRTLVSWGKVRGNGEAWVSRVAANLAVDLVRRQRRNQPLIESAQPRDPADRIVVALALKRLPRRQRDALLLHHVVGYSADETAAAMGVSPKTVKTHLQRGRAALRGELGEYFEGVSYAN